LQSLFCWQGFQSIVRVIVLVGVVICPVPQRSGCLCPSAPHPAMTANCTVWSLWGERLQVTIRDGIQESEAKQLIKEKCDNSVLDFSLVVRLDHVGYVPFVGEDDVFHVHRGVQVCCLMFSEAEYQDAQREFEEDAVNEAWPWDDYSHYKGEVKKSRKSYHQKLWNAEHEHDSRKTFGGGFTYTELNNEWKADRAGWPFRNGKELERWLYDGFPFWLRMGFGPTNIYRAPTDFEIQRDYPSQEVLDALCAIVHNPQRGLQNIMAYMMGHESAVFMFYLVTLFGGALVLDSDHTDWCKNLHRLMMGLQDVANMTRSELLTIACFRESLAA
jgi:hypothetical protein